MTENEARHMLTQSPTETAAEMLWFLGRGKAQKLAADRVTLHATMKKPHAMAVAFWGTVMRHLEAMTLDPIKSPSDFAAARLQQLEAFHESR